MACTVVTVSTRSKYGGLPGGRRRSVHTSQRGNVHIPVGMCDEDVDWSYRLLAPCVAVAGLFLNSLPCEASMVDMYRHLCKVKVPLPRFV
jgi:hypothetical protein